MGYTGRPFLLVDDDALVVSALERLLRHAARRPVVVARSHHEALEVLGRRSDWIGLMLDVVLEPGSEERTGFDVLEVARRTMPAVEAVMVTGQVDAALINRAARLCATYVCKPAGLEDLRPFIQRALAADCLPDPRVAAAADAVVRQSGLESKRAAELLRLSLTGRTPDEVAAAMDIGRDTYAHHVSLVLHATGARSIEHLVNRILRSALGIGLG